jgi:hypothetical protein
MSNGVLNFVKHFIADESGQAKEEYSSAIAFALIGFVAAILLFLAIQTGFVTTMGHIIGGGLNKMAAGAGQ